MSHIAESVEVEAPVTATYERWLASPGYPRFLHGVEAVRLSGSALHWVTEVNGEQRESEATVTELIPGERIAWQPSHGTDAAGVVTFHALDTGRTRVMLQLDHTPHGVLDSVTDWLGFTAHDAQRCLQSFKTTVEQDTQGS
ncbi:SRPBCC family protein [Kitasatospora albolonga]|uniref:SRPBCC family protein n=1 Tax=Kitasatospora albolonga TaxID=68173 RepID=UPI0035EDC0C9